MSAQKNLSKKEILKLISQLRDNPSDKKGLLFDLGIAGAGVAGAVAIAAVAGAGYAPIGFGITALTGVVFVVAAPVGLVVGAAVGGGATAYSVTKAVKFKARQQGRREQMIQQLSEMLRDVKYQETKSLITESDKTKFILFLEDPMQLNLMSYEDASDLIQLVENGQISLFEAYQLVKDILKEHGKNKKSNPTVLLPELLKGDRRSSGRAIG